NEVNITSPEQNPTSANPIPIHIHFEGGVDELDTPDFYVTNGVMENLLRQDPNFIYGGSALGLENFQVKLSTSQLIGAFLSDNIEELLLEELKESVISIDFNKNNELFYLTLNDGIFKVDVNGNKVRVIPGNRFDSPLDMIINRENGNIYV